VLVLSPSHSASLATLSIENILYFLQAFRRLHRELALTPYIRHIQLFENRGPLCGRSCAHPHFQCWSTDYIPTVVDQELVNLTAYKQQHSTCMLCDVASQEASMGTRVLFAQEGWLCIVPYWAMHPFETMLISTRCISSMLDLTLSELEGLANSLRIMARTFDALFTCEFSYTMGVHQLDGSAMHLHIHWWPPLQRSSTVRKWITGFDVFGEGQRDSTPEQAAERLRASLPKY
jgi:UDPglucose--hexose-1-phosphate uridylyltransferase